MENKFGTNLVILAMFMLSLMCLMVVMGNFWTAFFLFIFAPVYPTN